MFAAILYLNTVLFGRVTMPQTSESNSRWRHEGSHATRPNDATRGVSVSRTVRFSIDLHSPLGVVGNPRSASDRCRNSFAALPSMEGLGLFCELTVSVHGEPDSQTGYLINISAIDAAVRSSVIPLIERRVRDRHTALAEAILRDMVAELQSSLGGLLERVRWNLTPYYSLAMNVAAPHRVLLTQSFEFAAAHRLNCPELSDEVNRDVFGKCNNPSGHGHNYRLDVTVEKPLVGDVAMRLNLSTIERIVDEHVIRRFDHKHLNVDVAEFASLNPSVENIARVCHDLLTTPIREAGGCLRRVTVWETEKTCCSYPVGD
jgi:6-pyruvoyltetrahydropterin/6-carboxytetrahydropterin synthase